MGTVIFNGVSTVDLGIIVQTPPTYQYPEKDMTLTHIPGRNGDIATHNGCYKNVERSYYFASIFRKGTGFIENAQELIAWLHSADGYARLEDSYDPEVYRLALYKESQELTNVLDQVTAVQAVFECKPQRFLKEGEIQQKFTLGSEIQNEFIENPTKFVSAPLIEIRNNDPGWDEGNILTLTLTEENGEEYTMIFTPNVDENLPTNIFVDCDFQMCYTILENGNIQPFNQNVVLTNGFPKLKPGKTFITYGTDMGKQGYDADVYITPRWWKL